jgi:hypothetical protein
MSVPPLIAQPNTKTVREGLNQSIKVIPVLLKALNKEERRTGFEKF